MKNNILIPFLAVLLVAGSFGSAYASGRPSCDNYPYGAGDISAVATPAGFKILATGGAAVDFDDADEILDAITEATMEAKAAISKFFNETIQTEDGIESASVKHIKISKTSQGTKKSASKEKLKVQYKKMASNSKALLRGVAKLAECYTKGKQVLVSVGLKPETIAAAEAATGAIGKSVSRTPTVTAPPPKATTGAGASGTIQPTRTAEKISKPRGKAKDGSTVRNGNCVEYKKEAAAIEGVVPKFHQNGKLRAFVIYGAATFFVAKSSLIGKARRKAEMRAKRAFSEFMKENLSSDTSVEKMKKKFKKTDRHGNKVKMKEELNTHIEVMRSNTSAVLSGLVKLAECVDRNEKIVLVAIGWKPNISKSAATGPSTKVSNRGNSGKDVSNVNKNRGQLPGIRIIIVKVEGIGANLKRATNEALRSAVAQVFGEEFASQTKTVDLTDTAEVSGNGKSAGVAVERSSTKESMSSKTKGLIQSYRYLKKQKHPEGMKVYLKVSLPKYESGLDPNKTRMIVLRPKLSSSIRASGRDLDVFNAALQDTVESILNKSRKLTVLDRRYVKHQIAELNTIASGNSPISELARLGNRAGADLLVVSEIISYDQTQEKTQFGNKKFERTIFNAEISVKVIDVATSNILFSQRFPFRKQRIRASNPASKFGSKIGSRLARRVARDLGGGMQRGTSGFGGSASMDAVVKRVKKTFDDAKKDAKDDW